MPAWNEENAAHLLRRATHGPRPRDIARALKRGFDRTLEDLFEPPRGNDRFPRGAEDLSDLQGWWLKRMTRGKAPLTERMTLLWHNHFATSHSKIDDLFLMHLQNRTLRRDALGSFRELVLAMARDPAMLIWLDNETNVAGNPNENFARELMELFTTGVLDKAGQPNYTERDVEEAARAFTGWGRDDEFFEFNEDLHDFGPKTFRGLSGDLDGTDVIEQLVTDPATARRVAWRIYSFFAHPVDLADPVLDPLESAYLANDTALRPVLEALFQSDAFYSATVRQQHVKSPVELAVGAVRQLGVKIAGNRHWELAEWCTAMGQSLFAPPSVFGWKEGLAWVGTSGMQVRSEFAAWLTATRGGQTTPRVRFRPEPLLGSRRARKKLMACTRRDLLKGMLAGAPFVFRGPQSFVRAAFGGGTGTRNLILFELFGGNDGLNTIVPFGLDGGVYYDEYRQRLAVAESTLLKIDDRLGFHSAIAELKSVYDSGRMAICQGVGYPTPNFSHETSAQIWASGDPTASESSGWFARHLARRPPTDFPCSADLSGTIGGVLRGSGLFAPGIESVERFAFPVDFFHPRELGNRRTAYDAMVAGLDGATGPVGEIARTAGGLLDLIDTFATVPAFPHVGAYPDSPESTGLQETVRLIDADLGLRTFHVGISGFDTHSKQDQGEYHAQLLRNVSQGVSAMITDLESVGRMEDTLIVVYSEFGRTVYENGSEGTDHGTVAPVFVIGDSVRGGLTTPHPGLRVDDLTEDEGEPSLTTDFRDVFGTVVDRWLVDDPNAVFPGHGYTDLGFLG